MTGVGSRDSMNEDVEFMVWPGGVSIAYPIVPRESASTPEICKLSRSLGCCTGGSYPRFDWGRGRSAQIES